MDLRTTAKLADLGAARPATTRSGAGGRLHTCDDGLLGLPGLNRFVGEFLILSGTFLTHRWWAVVATVGVVLSAIYLLWAYQQVFQHRPDEANANTRDLNWREGAVMVPLVGLIIFLGVYPKPVLDRITPTVSALVNRVESQNGKQQPVPAASSLAAPDPLAASPLDSWAFSHTGPDTKTAGDASSLVLGPLHQFQGTSGIAYALGASVGQTTLGSHAAAMSFEHMVNLASTSGGDRTGIRGGGVR